MKLTLDLFINLSIRIFPLISNKFDNESFVFCPFLIYKMLKIVSIDDLILNEDLSKLLLKRDEFKMSTMIFYNKNVLPTFLSNFDSGCLINKNISSNIDKSVSRQTNKVLENVSDYLSRDYLAMLFFTSKFDEKCTTKNITYIDKVKCSINSKYKAVILPYKDSKYKILLILPENDSINDDNSDNNNDSINDDNSDNNNDILDINQIVNDCTDKVLRLEIPHIEIETELDIKDIISKSKKKQEIVNKIDNLEMRVKSKVYINLPEINREDWEDQIIFNRQFYFYIIKEITYRKEKVRVPLFMGKNKGY